MTKLTEKERIGFEQIMETDLLAINSKVVEQIRFIWDKARDMIIKQKGHDKLAERKYELKVEIEERQEELHQIENELNSVDLTKQQAIELGGAVGKYDRIEGANFYDIPITSQFEYEVVQYIKKHIDIEAPAKFLHDLTRSCMRELTMVGTFEEAKEVYEKLYALDFKKYGVDIPPRLTEIKRQNPTLQPPKEMLKLEDGRED